MITIVNKRNSQYDVYIGRGSKWGNPFILGKHGNREQVIAMYEEYLIDSPELLSSIKELADKRLGCYCSPLACHGDVLKRICERNAS